MTRRSSRLATAALAVACATALGLASPAAAVPGRLATPTWSGLDARDYSGPIGAPGTLLAQTPLDPSVSLPAAGPARRILYATTDVHGRPAVSTGAVFLPRRPAPPAGYPVIAWAHGTTGLGDDCTPSALPRSERDTRYLDHWLDRGYAVVATDYAGLGTPGMMSYLSGTVAAHSVVDAMKAAHRADLPLAPAWAIVGQSQGAGAALNAARHATAYSRGSGLDYRGVVATGTPANIELIVGQAGPGFPPVALPAALNAYAAYILAGFEDARPDLRVAETLTPRGRAVLKQAAILCNDDLAAAVDGERAADWFRRPLSSIPGMQAALAHYMATPFSGYDRPVFLGQGLRDTDVPAPSAVSLYTQMLGAGQPVEFHLYPQQDHSGTVLASMPDSTAFLARIMR